MFPSYIIHVMQVRNFTIGIGHACRHESLFYDMGVQCITFIINLNRYVIKKGTTPTQHHNIRSQLMRLFWTRQTGNQDFQFSILKQPQKLVKLVLLQIILNLDAERACTQFGQICRKFVSLKNMCRYLTPCVPSSYVIFVRKLVPKCFLVTQFSLKK